MKTQVIKKKKLPPWLPHGAITKIANKVKCSRNTAHAAIYHDTPGIVSEKCREEAREVYGISIT